MAIDQNCKIWLKEIFAERAKFDEPMAKHTSFRVGGCADVFVEPENMEELCQVVKGAGEQKISWIVVGGGTNLLVKDSGVRGIVISTRKTRRQVSMESMGGDRVAVTAAGGTLLSTLCRFAIEKGCMGMNFAMGIPGTVGGAIRMNAGTATGTMQNVITRIKVLDPGGQVREIGKRGMTFSYRNLSIGDMANPLIIEGCFGLQKGDPGAIRREADAALERRRKTQPTGTASAGCFFKNPVSERSAGELIDRAGLKGREIGGAKISEKHANYIINTGGGTAADIMALMETVQEEIYKVFQIKLEPEVKIVG